MEAISYKSRSDLAFLQGKVNSARYVAQVVNPVLLSFLRQEGDMIFQQDNARPQTPPATQLVLRGYKNCRGQQELQITRQLNTHGT